MDYELFLTEKLNIIKLDKNWDVDIEVSSEQAFAKLKTFKPNTIYVIIKKLATDFQYNVLSQPLQIMAISEQNQIDITKELFEIFCGENNWKTEKDGTTYVKQQYSMPVVLSNFNEVGFGYRSVVYVSGMLEILENVVDISSVKIDGVEYKPISFSIAYQMTGNTQAVGTQRIAVTQKSIATFNVTISVALLDDLFCNKVLDVLNESESGNVDFSFEIAFNNNTTITKDMKLTSAQIITAPNQAPSLQLAFMR